MKVAVQKTGPGVNCPTATASSSWPRVSQCEPIDEVGLQEGDQDITATEQHRADFEEDQEHFARG